jgi:hypothetical protein
LKHDFDVLELDEALRPKEKIRDVSKFKKYLNQHNQAMSLKNLTEKFLGKEIQTG